MLNCLLGGKERTMHAIAQLLGPKKPKDNLASIFKVPWDTTLKAKRIISKVLLILTFDFEKQKGYKRTLLMSLIRCLYDHPLTFPKTKEISYLKSSKSQCQKKKREKKRVD